MLDRTTIHLDSPLSIPFRNERGLILFDGLTPDGKKLNVELDTCTSPNAVRTGLALDCGWPKGNSVKSSGLLSECSEPAFEVEIPEFNIGDLVINNLFCQTDPLDGPVNVDVMLGERFLRDVVVQVSFAENRVAFYRPGDWRPPRETPGNTLLNLSLEVGVLPSLSELVLIDRKFAAPLALLDTGFNGSMLLSYAFAEFAGLLPDSEDAESLEAGGYGGPATLQQITVEHLAIGKFEFNHVTAYCPSALSSESPLSNPMWINIGTGLLSKFKVTWDIPGHRFALEKSGSD